MVRYLGCELRGCSLPTERATPVVNFFSSEKCIKDENASLPFVNLHLYDDIGPKQAKNFNFGLLLAYQGFWDDFLSFFFLFWKLLE
jgi:hypothetical protein